VKGCLTVVVVVLLVSVLFLGYLGFVPGLSSAFGADKPRDLGVKYSQTDSQSAADKAKTKFQALPAAALPSDSVKVSANKVPVSTTFSDKELTARVAAHQAAWKFYPVSNAQVKIGPDGTIEAAGVIQMDRVYDYAAAQGISQEIVNTVIDRLKLSGTNPTFYVKGTGVVTDNKVTSLRVDALEFGRFSVPADWLASYKGTAISLIEDRLRVSGIQAKSVTFGAGGMKFDGSLPETVGFSPAK
jgi:hypothetical protein